MTRLALVLSLVGSFWLASRTDAAESKPNVLFIAIDDLNDWVGVLGGHPQSRTPNVDRVAKMGMLFVRAYCAAPACNPSRTALLTGLRPSTSGVYHNNQPWRKALPDAVTLMQYFMKHGYRVMGGGKILHGRFREPSGWHEYHRPRNKYTKRDLPPNGIGGNMMWGPLEVDDAAMLDTDLTDWAIGKLKQKYEKPFFLAVGYYKPHLAWHAPKKYFEKHPQSKVKLPKVLEGDLDDIPQPGKRMARPQGDHRKILKKGVWKEAVQAYLATSTYMDHQLGRLLDTFLASPYAKNTIVVLWSDHGWNLGEKQHWRKFALWENTNHVPMAFVVPGMTRRGQVCRRPVNLLDIYPTLVELCGLPRQKQLEGNSLVPLLKNPKAEWKHASLSTHGRNNHSVRTERWRYIRYADGSEELYDHDKDPEEWKNLASDPKYAETKKTLKEHLPEKNVENATKIDTRRKSKKRGRPKGRAWLVDPTEVVDEVASHRAAWGRVFVRRKRLESIEGRFLVGFSLDVLLGLEADACGDGDFDEPDAAPKDEKADKREGDCLQDQGISGDEKALDAFVEDPQTDQYQQPSEKLTQPKADHSTLRR